MPFKKKGDRVDIHIWLPEEDVTILDAICKEFEISRATAVSGLLQEYATNHNPKDPKNDRDQEAP